MSSTLRRRRTAAPTPPTADATAPPLAAHDRLAALRAEHSALTAAAMVLSSRLARASGRLAELSSASTQPSRGHAGHAVDMNCSAGHGQDKARAKRTLPTPPKSTEPNHDSRQDRQTANGNMSSSVRAEPLLTSVHTTPSVGARTTRMYFDDTHMFTADATVVSVTAIDGGKHSIVLDRTVFHPQGGGQPADSGVIQGADWQFVVHHVVDRKEDGAIEHHGDMSVGGTSVAPGALVSMRVDEDRRRLHARLHSAGHLLDSALANLKRTDLVPSKGYHFADGPYVEYVGSVSDKDKDALIEAVNAECQRLIDAAVGTVVTMEPPVDGRGAPTRVVDVAGCRCPCGGTHVKSTAEIGSIKVTRVKKVKKCVKFSYTLD